MDSCVLCAVIAGDEPAVWVEREEHAVAFAPLPDSALAPGHTLVVPVEHTADLLSAGPTALAATTALAQRVARAMKGALGATGTVVLQASGADAGRPERAAPAPPRRAVLAGRRHDALAGATIGARGRR